MPIQINDPTGKLAQFLEQESKKVKVVHADARRSEVAASSAPVPMMDAQKKVEKALMHIVTYKVFFGALILKLKVGVDRRGHPTLWTDGRVLRYNAEYVSSLSFGQLVASLAKEVAHCAFGHPYRRGQRDLKLWQKACSYVVNEILLKDGDFDMVPGSLVDPRFTGMRAEQVFEVLKKEQEEAQEQQQQQQQQQQSQQQQKGKSGSKSEKQQQQKNQGGDEEEQSKPGNQSQQNQEREGNEGGDEQQQQPGKAEKGEVEEEGRGKPEKSQDGKEGKPEETDDVNDDLEDGKGDGGEEHEEDGSGEKGDGQGDEQAQDLQDAPGEPMGDVLDAGTSGASQDEEGEEQDGEAIESPIALSEAEMKEGQKQWEQAAASAAIQAEIAGNLSGDAVRQIRGNSKPQLSYAEYVRMFASALVRDDTYWGRCRRSSVDSDTYLPTFRNEAVGKIVVAVDTSGSVRERDLAQFQSEYQVVHEDMKPEETIILYADAAVRGEQRIGRHDAPEFDMRQVRGGGGTDFRSVFKWINAKKEEGENIIGLIYITDLDGTFPTQKEKWFDSELPVLWVSSDHSTTEAPFGETCFLFNR